RALAGGCVATQKPAHQCFHTLQSAYRRPLSFSAILKPAGSTCIANARFEPVPTPQSPLDPGAARQSCVLLHPVATAERPLCLPERACSRSLSGGSESQTQAQEKINQSFFLR